MRYIIFFTGVASTPNSVGLMCTTTGEVIHEIETSLPSGKATRERYEKLKALLVRKYQSILI